MTDKQTPQHEIPQENRYETLMSMEPYILAIAINFREQGFRAKAVELINKFLNPDNEVDENQADFFAEMRASLEKTPTILDKGFRQSEMQRSMDEGANLPIDPESYIRRNYGKESITAETTIYGPRRIVEVINQSVNTTSEPKSTPPSLESWTPPENTTIN